MSAAPKSVWPKPRRGLACLSALALALALLALAAPVASADLVVCGPGAGAGECEEPSAVAVDRTSALLYVADDGNRRIDVFDANDGTFLRAFGWDVVASGPGKVAAPSEQQSVSLGANTSGGSFTLRLGFFETESASIAFDAPAASVEAALNALPSIGGVGGSVSVTGSPGGPYAITFGGALAEDGVRQMIAEASGLTVSGGEGEVSVATVQEGGAYEICVPADGDTCKAGSIGGGGGQFDFANFDHPSLVGIAVDNDPASPAYHDVYVLDDNNHRLQRFHPDGEFVLAAGGKVNRTKVEAGAPGAEQNVCTKASGDVCQAGVEGETPGRFNFKPKLDLGPGGLVHVADIVGSGDRRVQKLNPSGGVVESCSSLEAGKLEPPPGPLNLLGFALASDGSFYLASAGGVAKYDPSCTALTSFHEGGSGAINALALDPADNVYVADASSDHREIYRYDPSHTLEHVLYGNGTLKTFPASLAPFESANGELFAAEAVSVKSLMRVVQIASEPPGPVVNPDPEQTNADPIGNTTATLNTKINPEGKATSYRFEYVEDASYEANGDGFASPNVKTAPVPDAALAPAAQPSFAPPLFRLSAASQAVGCQNPETEAPLPGSPCLVPETEYHLRAIAANADGEDVGPEVTFVTKAPFEILATWASGVGFEAAQLGVEVNPLNIAAKGRFEYVEEATCLKDEEELGPGHCFEHAESSATLDFGAGEVPVVRTVQLASLSPATTYRFRVLVEDFFTNKVEEGSAFTTFATPGAPSTGCANRAFRLGASAPLPDCRAYEMVSPLDKEGGEIVVQGTADTIARAEHVQGAAAVPAAGRGLTYSSYRAFGDAASAPYSSQYLAVRDPLGDPQQGWRSHGISPPRGAPLTALVQEAQYKAFSADLGLALLQSDSEPPLAPGAIAGFPALYERDNAAGSYEAICPVKAEGFYRKPQGTSADWDTVVFRTGAKLSEEASDAKLPGSGDPIAQTYACRGGEVAVVSVLPPAQGGKASDTSSGAGTVFHVDSVHRYDSVHNAVSADAERIYWTDAGSQSHGPGKIYLRERPFAEGEECAGPQAPCTAAVSEAVGGMDAQFWTASPDGAVAIFSFTEGALAGNLYRFEAETGTTSLIAEDITGVAGWSEDASRIYFVSTAELAPGAIAGKANLYFQEAGGESELVAALPSGTNAIYRCNVADKNPFFRCTRASADGSRLVFLSRDSLTGYDNRDAQSGEPDSEVFLYDAEAEGGAGELTCVSCNPSGARPVGRELKLESAVFWIAARIPVWQHSLYASRALSADGRRLFFESFDALVPTDTNGAQDVYQWEEPGKGDCDADSSTPGPTYFPQNGGCLALISSGRSPRDSFFLDASADGSDVFFKTAASLLPQDPGLIDIYDARAGGGFPPPAPQKPPCEGEACQSPPAPPAPASPVSESFRGAGNGAVNPQRRRCSKGKRRAVRRGKLRCVKRSPRRSRRQRGGRR